MLQKKKIYFVLLSAFLLALCVSCSKESTKESTENVNEDSLKHSFAAETVSEAEEPTDVVYKTEADFLNHPDGVKFQKAAYRGAKAYLNGDLDELAGYLSDSCSVPEEKFDFFKDIDYMILKWNLHDMESKDSIGASYEFLLKGEDSVSYVTLHLITVDDDWKIDSIGLEK